MCWMRGSIRVVLVYIQVACGVNLSPGYTKNNVLSVYAAFALCSDINTLLPRPPRVLLHTADPSPLVLGPRSYCVAQAPHPWSWVLGPIA